MREYKKLSYSALTCFEQDRAEFYLKYLANIRPARLPQTDAMSIGSAFDARVKSALHHALGGTDPQFEFDTIFTSQVEEQNRDWARLNSIYVFDSYVQSGAYADLLRLLEQSEDIRFEFDITKEINGVPLNGKPDLKFRYVKQKIVLDWKVRGFCSKYPTSPSKGYCLCRDGFIAAKQSKKAGCGHPDLVLMEKGDLQIATAYLEQSNDEYADQLSLYSWLLDEPVGSEDPIFMIHELCSKPGKADTKGILPLPTIRVAEHRARITPAHQQHLMERIKTCWNAIKIGPFFEENNEERCQEIEDMAVALAATGDLDKWCNEVSRPQFKR